MNPPKHFRLVLPTLLGVLVSGLVPVVHGANNVAPPNILWHNKVTGGTRVWVMNGTNTVNEITLPATSDDTTWKPVGTGDFNGDGQPDIVWQNETTGQNAVWYMNGTIMFAGALIQSAGDLSWRIVGVADFNGDRKPDLLWQNSTLGLNAVWLMNNTTPIAYTLITSAGDPNWRIVATGDLNRDGKTDILLRNQSTGQNAVWYMNGTDLAAGDLIKMANGSEANETDQDWQIVGTADLDGDGKLDLLWRHAVLGTSVAWFLNGGVVTTTGYVGRQEFDTSWRIASQDTSDSNWRLRTADFTWLRGIVTTTPPQVTLQFRLSPNANFGVTLQRRLISDTAWTTLASGLAGDTYTDSTVALGSSYEYRAFRVGFNGNQYSAAEHVAVGLDLPAVENRGTVVLLVDKTLSSQVSVSVDQLRQDLVGDGWNVVHHDVPRHIDDYSSAASFRTNAYNLTNVIKPLIRADYAQDPNTRAVICIGHVTIPYSGSFNPDGHTCGPPPYGPDHRGAWPADMYFGDLDGTWTDTVVNLTNCNYTEPNNVPGDGKFDQDGIPSPFAMKLAVGRIDFARMPVFTDSPPPGVAPKSEAALIQQYLNKNHLYRLKRLNWQTANAPARAMVYGHFHDGRDNQIIENARHTSFSLSPDTNRLVLGDFVLQRNAPNVWGFLSGAGGPDRVNNAIPILEHTAADLTKPANEPKTVFYMLLSSYLGDWNLANNNYLRALIATPNYGLAAVWTRFALWRTDMLGLGEPLGMAQVRMVNEPKNQFYDQSRDLAIMGDPTLRTSPLALPATFSAKSQAGKVQLSWAVSEAGAQYYVYRGPSLSGPFTRISANAVAGTTFTDNSPNSAQRTYMVRALLRTTTGNGSYLNISQGVFAAAN